MNKHYDIGIIGGGPAGLTAAIYARRAGKTAVIFEKAVPGGQITLSPQVDNYPGLPGLPGLELADKMAAQGKALGAELLPEEALALETGPEKTIFTASGNYNCKAVILATGMKHRTLGLAGEQELAGISYCAVCDGAFYRDKEVAVCGGGNTALQEALYLADLCRKVTVIHRRDSFRGDPILVEALQKRENVAFSMDTVITALEGDQGALKALTLESTLSGARKRLEVSGLFEAIGYLPDTGIAKPLALTDRSGFLKAGENCLTEAEGIFAAGDCREKEVRQLLGACSDGAVAALAACRYCL